MKTMVVQKSLVLHKGKFLILRRSDTDDRRPLQWDLPGGLLDVGETLEQGIIREINEESGIGISQLSLLFSKTEHRKWESGESNVVFLLYKATTDSPKVTLSYEHDQFKWVTLDEAFELFEYPLHVEFFKYIKENSLDL